MSDIAAFVLAQLDAEQAAAEAATAGEWVVYGEGDDYSDTFIYAGGTPVNDLVDYAYVGQTSCDLLESTTANSDADAAHIAYWDPARVLADIAAKRRLVAQYAEQAARCPEDDWPEDGDMSAAPLADHARWAMKCLALPFAGRVGFDEAWQV